jgi:hypothetical protein
VQYLVAHDSACDGFLLWLKLAPTLDMSHNSQSSSSSSSSAAATSSAAAAGTTLETGGSARNLLVGITSLFGGSSSPAGARLKASQSAVGLSSLDRHTTTTATTSSTTPASPAAAAAGGVVVGSPPDLASALAYQERQSGGGAHLYAVTLPTRSATLADDERRFVNALAAALQACLYCRLTRRPLSELHAEPIVATTAAAASSSSASNVSTATAGAAVDHLKSPSNKQ